MELTNESKNLAVNPQHLLYYVPAEENKRDTEGHDGGDADDEYEDSTGEKTANT